MAKQAKKSKKQTATATQPAKKVVKSLMTGKPVVIDADTPFCCDPSTETYWSM